MVLTFFNDLYILYIYIYIFYEQNLDWHCFQNFLSQKIFFKFLTFKKQAFSTAHFSEWLFKVKKQSWLNVGQNIKYFILSFDVNDFECKIMRNSKTIIWNLNRKWEYHQTFNRPYNIISHNHLGCKKTTQLKKKQRKLKNCGWHRFTRRV